LFDPKLVDPGSILVYMTLKAHPDLITAELSAAKIAIKLQLLPSCSIATCWYASLSIH